MLRKGIILGLIFVLCCSLPFIHFEFKKISDWEPYSTHYKKYNEIIKNYNIDRGQLIYKLENNQISTIDFLSQIKTIDAKKITDLSSYHKIKKQLKAEYSFQGYSAFRYFLYAIGLPVFGLILSIILIDLVLNPNKIKHLKKVYLFGTLGFLWVSCFWILQTLLTKTDFPSFAYNISYIFLAIITTIVLFLIISFLNRKEKKKNKRENELQSFLENGNELVNLLKSK